MLQNINKLNRSLEGVIAVGNEFGAVEALWSQFEGVMAQGDEEEVAGAGKEEEEREEEAAARKEEREEEAAVRKEDVEGQGFEGRVDEGGEGGRYEGDVRKGERGR